MPERERHSREQMNMIYKIIINKGLVEKEDIYFVSGRETPINHSVNRHYKVSDSLKSAFRMYGPKEIIPFKNDNGNSHEE